jgi:hypothetical protein
MMIDKEEVAEKQLVATGDTPRLRRKGSTAKDWKMKAEVSLVQDDGIDDIKEVMENNKEDGVSQDFCTHQLKGLEQGAGSIGREFI